MTSSHYSTIENNPGHAPRSSGRGHWSVANITVMILGFIFFAPLGFVVLVWTLLGHPIQELPAWVRKQWRRFSGSSIVATEDSTDNTVFNEYQQTQYDRIREIKEEIRNRAEAFRAYRENLKRRQDQQEFEDFMSSKPEKSFD